MNALKWGILGPGQIAHQFAQALQKVDDGHLLAVASRNYLRAEAFAKQYGAPKAFGDYARLLADPEIDLVYIATPHSHHFELAKACLLAGKHVLLEKPLTVNAAQTEILIRLSQRHERVFQEALWSRFMPCLAQVKRWLDSGEIGELQTLDAQIGFAFSHLENHRLTEPALAGGALLDLGVYPVSISQYFLAEHPSEIQAMAQIHPQNVDQNVLVNMRYPSGRLSQFIATMGTESSNTMTLHGDKGFIRLCDMFWVGTNASLVKNGELVADMTFEHPQNGFEYQIEATMENVRQGRLYDPRMSHSDSLNVMVTLDEIRRQIGLTFPEEIEAID